LTQNQHIGEPLILTSLKRSKKTHLDIDTSSSSSEDRQLFLANLLNEFQSRDIVLRDKYPKLYRDLCMYVEDNKPFTPVCLFPRDLKRDNLFMCLIMPNSDNYDDNNVNKEEEEDEEDSFNRYIRIL
jgi:hypothetical protein